MEPLKERIAIRARPKPGATGAAGSCRGPGASSSHPSLTMRLRLNLFSSLDNTLSAATRALRKLG